MKRNAAIIGPTPAHLRWAIEVPCRWRRIDEKNFTDTTAKQLRILAEYSLAIREGRTWQDWCFRDTTALAAQQPVWGFRLSETLRPFGGSEAIEQTCRQCPAHSQPDHLADCFGWILATPTTSVATTPENTGDGKSVIDSWSQRLWQTIVGQHLVTSWQTLFRKTQPIWYGLWNYSPLSREQLDLLRMVISAAQQTQPLDGQADQWHSLVLAMEKATTAQLPLHVDWINAGHSDGTQWRLPPFCFECRAPRPQLQSACPVCQSRRTAEPARVKKVLGFRPYLDLRRVVGEQAAAELHRQFLAARSIA